VPNHIRPFAALLLVLALIAGCTNAQSSVGISHTQRPLDYSRDMPAIAPHDLTLRGLVISSSDQTAYDMTQLPAGTVAKKMSYWSISGITGRATVVDGAVFVPPGDPPAGGWPVVGHAHYTVGVTPDCGTTVSDDLSGNLPAVANEVGHGYAVAYTDYVGMGPSGNPGSGPDQEHPYLEPKSAAFNVIDAVRAAHALVPQLSTRWVAFGASQGGEAAWAAAEYFPEYGEGTELLGAAAAAPALDVSGIAAEVKSGSLSDEQKSLYPLVVAGLAAVDPQIDPADYLHGALDDTAVLTCLQQDADRKNAVIAKVQPSDFTPSSPAAVDRLAQRLSSYALPQRPTTVPILVVYGGADQTIAPAWTEAAIGRACALGDNVTRIRLDDQGHDINTGVLVDDWMTQRFADVPATGNC
jgi:pimeloyl-ACP methyl ester carboxylesterase